MSTGRRSASPAAAGSRERTLVARYNTEWLIEKNGLRTPSDTRTAWYQTAMGAAA